MMEKLTRKQQEVLTVIKKYIAEHGYSPSVREVCDLMNLSSTATGTTAVQGSALNHPSFQLITKYMSAGRDLRHIVFMFFNCGADG